MANLADDDLLLVQRTSAGISTNYSITGSALKEDLGGPDGLITPPVAVLTPLNGAGLNDGQSYTPMSSAYVSTDSTPIHYRWFPELITTISGGSWVDENNLFNGSGAIHAELTGAADSVSQFVFTPHPGWIDGETDCYVYGTAGGIIEILDDTGTVLRTYSYLSSPGDYAVGIVRSDQKIRFTSNGANESIYVAAIGGLDGGAVDYVISGRVAFEFTDDTDLDKMVAPIIQTDENGDVKVPTTSTVDSTTTIAGEDKGWYYHFVGNGAEKTIQMSSDGISPSGARMMWAKTDDSRSGVITDNVALDSGYFFQTTTNGVGISGGPVLNEGTTTLPVANSWNKNGYNNYITEIGVAPKVLDIVPYTGDGSYLNAVPHNLGCKPGMIIIKRIDSNASWAVWHKDLTLPENLFLNSNVGESYGGYFHSEHTKEEFYIGGVSTVNASNGQYVAYVFAADTPGKIKCGTYNGNGSSQNINTGMFGGFVLVKRRNVSNNWCAVTDEMTSIGGHRFWEVNTTAQLAGGSPRLSSAGNGFWLYDGNSDYNGANSPYIYLCVSRDLTGPQSTQLNLLGGQDLEYFTDGTQITSNLAASRSNQSFETESYVGNGSSINITPGTSTSRWWDSSLSTANKWMVWIKGRTVAYNHVIIDSERSPKMGLSSNRSVPEQSEPQAYLGVYNNFGYSVGNDSKVNANNAGF